RPALALPDEEETHRPGAVRLLQDFVDGLVREQGVVWIGTARRERRTAAREDPQVAVADHAHEKRLQRIDVADADIELAVLQRHVFAGNRALRAEIRGLAEKNRVIRGTGGRGGGHRAELAVKTGRELCGRREERSSGTAGACETTSITLHIVIL